MTIAFFLYTTGWGGVEVYLQDLIKSLAKDSKFKDLKLKLYLYTPPEEIRERVVSSFKILNVDVREMDHWGVPSACAVKSKPTIFAGAMKVREFISSKKQSVLKKIFTRLIPRDFKSAFHQWIMIRRGAHALKEAGIDAAHFLHGAYPSLKLAVLAAWMAGIKIRISDVHGEPQKQIWKGVTHWIINGLAKRAATHYKVLSECMKAQLRDRCGIVRNVAVIPNSIDPIDFMQLVRPLGIRELYGIKPHELIACIVGRLFEGKGCQEVISAAALPTLQGIHFFFVGEGPLEAELKLLVRRLSVEENIHFLGFRPDVASLLMEADFLVIPSYSEGAPLVVLEAMALAKPIVATRVGAIPEMLGDQYPIKLISPGDVAQLRDVLNYVCSLTQEKRELIGKLLQERVFTNYSKNKNSQQIISLYA